MRFPAGRPVSVVMTKWGDRPHWRFDGLYLGADDHGDWIGYPVGSRFARPGRSLITDFASVGLAPHHDAAHLAAFNTPTEQIRAEVYVDMTTPAVWEDTTLRAVDLDLDVARRWDGEVVLLDQDEFEQHQLALGYPPEIITMAEESAERVYAALAAGEPPYDGSAERWLAALADLTR